MPPINVSKEYSDILKQYMAKFKLEAIDIAYLIKSNKEVIGGLLDSKKGVVLKTLEAIAQIFALRYYQFGNPDFPIPDASILPQATKDRILFREKEGSSVPIKYSTLNLTNKILDILSTYKKGEEFLPSEVGEKIDLKFKLRVPSKQITGRFKNDLSEFVEKTGNALKTKGKRGPSEEYYHLIQMTQES